MYPKDYKRHFGLKIISLLIILGCNYSLVGQQVVPHIKIDTCSLSIIIKRETIKIEKFGIPPIQIDPFDTRYSPIEMIPNGFELSLDQYQVEQSNSGAFVGAGILGFIGFSYGMWGKQPHTYTVLDGIEFDIDNPRLNSIIMGIGGAIIGAKLGSSIQRFSNERKKDPNKKIIEIQEGQGCLF